MPARVRATARVTWRVVEALAPEPFALRSVIAPSYPSPHSRKYTPSPTCQILPEIQALGCADGESVCGGGPAAPPDWGTHPQAASISLLTVGPPLIPVTAPEACCPRPPVSLWGRNKTHAHESHTPFPLQALKQGGLSLEHGPQRQMVLSPSLTNGTTSDQDLQPLRACIFSSVKRGKKESLSFKLEEPTGSCLQGL